MHRLWTTLVALMVLSACNDSARCEERDRAMPSDRDDVLVIGATYGELQDALVGSRSGTVTWVESSSLAEGFPPPGEADITVELLEPIETSNVDLERVGGGRRERLSCPDFVETQVPVRLMSGDGALDTELVLSATVHSTQSIRITEDVTDEELGNLDWMPREEGSRLTLTLEINSDGSVDGTLTLDSGSSDGDGSGTGMMAEVARWSAVREA